MPAPKGNKYAICNKGNTETKYDSRYCAVALKLGESGAGIEELAVELGVMRKTIYAWIEKYEEFGNATTRMREIAEVYWRKLGQDALFNRAFNERNYALQMMNRWKWNKKGDITSGGEKVQTVADAIAQMEEEMLAAEKKQSEAV